MNEPSRTLSIEESYIERIRAHMSDFTQAENRAATYILENSVACASMSIRELAAKCGSSISSIVRLCKTIGYSGFPELKFRMQQCGDVYAQDDLTIREADDLAGVKQKTAQFAQFAINRTLQELDETALEQAVGLLIRAQRVMLCAMGSACGAALAAANHLMSVGVNAVYLSDELLSLRAATFFRPGDVVIGINHDGYSKSVSDILMVAHQRGVSTVLLSSAPDSLAAKYADVILRTPGRNNQNALNFSTTTICQMLVMQMLVIGVWQKISASALTDSEQMLRYTNMKRYDAKTAQVRVEPQIE